MTADHEAPADEALHVRVDRQRLVVALLAVGIGLLLVSFVWSYAKGQGWQPFSLFVDRVIDADSDESIMNWYSSSVFLVAGLLAALAAARAPASRLGWWAAAAVLLLVSADEALGLHDIVKPRILIAVDERSPLAMVLALVAVAAAASAALFIAGQEPPVRWRLAAAAVLLPLAAVGIDMVGPDLTDDVQARLEAGYLLKATAEEAGELLVAVLAVDACLLAALRFGARSPVTGRPSRSS